MIAAIVDELAPDLIKRNAIGYENGSNPMPEAQCLMRSLYATAQSKQADQQYPDNGLPLRRASTAFKEWDS